MPSAFRRATGNTTAGTAPASGSSAGRLDPVGPSLGLKGVKPWTGGIHLTSVGLRELDTILGGGQPLGTCIVVEEDRWTKEQAWDLIRYWCSEAISQEQQLICPIIKTPAKSFESMDASFSDMEKLNYFMAEERLESLLDSLPRNLHLDKHRKADTGTSRNETTSMSDKLAAMSIVEEDEDGDGNEKDDKEGLDIAWQYRKSVQQERMGIRPGSKKSTSESTVFCHSYDLSGRLSDQLDHTEKNFQKFIHHIETKETRTDGFALFRSVMGMINTTSRTRQVARLLFFHQDVRALSVAIPLLLCQIRSASLPVVIMIAAPTQLSITSEWISLRRTSDVVLKLDGFAGRKEYPPPPEFSHLQGMLNVQKANTATAAFANGGGHFGDVTTTKRPAADIYGMKRDRRKLHLPLLHIPPEDFAAGGGSVGSGVRSGGGRPDAKGSKPNAGGMGCSSNMEGSPLDF